jgi:hypothetical protein
MGRAVREAAAGEVITPRRGTLRRAAMTTTWQPYREPLRTTVFRTFTIAAVIGAAFTLARGRPALWPMATLLALWPTFGGHWFELWFLKWLRPRLPEARIVQVIARLSTWFVAGLILAAGMYLTARAAGLRPAHQHGWWFLGLAFIAIELITHLVLHLRRRPSFYNGRG